MRKKGKNNIARSRKNQKGNQEVVNLALSINYDRPGGRHVQELNFG